MYAKYTNKQHYCVERAVLLNNMYMASYIAMMQAIENAKKKELDIK